MKTILRCVILLTLLTLLIPAGNIHAAQSSTISIYIDWVDTSQYPQVTVYLSAWGANGLPLTGLSVDQFALQEDSRPAFQPQAVTADQDAPLWVALVIDISGSMSGKPLEDAQDAAARFLDHLTPAQDQVAVIAFSDPLDPDPKKLNPKREIGFSGDVIPVYDLVEGLQADGKTQLYNAAAKAVRLFEGLPPGNRAILLLSDGRNEPAEVGDPQEAIRLAQEQRVPFYVVGLGNQIDLPYLTRLAAQTGGLFRPAPRSSELAQLYTEMADLLKTKQRITYTSNLPADGKAHTLKITLTAGGASADGELTIGPLPLIPTAAPTLPPPPEATPEPTAARLPPTAPPPPTNPPPEPAALPTAAPVQPQGILQIIFANPLYITLTVVVGGGLLWMILRLLLRLLGGKKKAGGEACARCGFDLTGVPPGPCPQCGYQRRLPKP